MKPYKNLSTPMLAAIGAAVLVVLLFLSYVLSSGMLHRKDTGIVLQSGSENAPTVSSGSQMLTAQSVADVTIGPDNAQKVIASLARPEAYSCVIENTLYYTGGSSTLRCHQYMRDNLVRIDWLAETGAVQSTLMHVGDVVYTWENGSTTFYKGTWGEFTDDAAAMLPTYEDVLDEGLVLSSAGRQDMENEPCIMVEFEREGYRCVYYVSAASGLLKQASFYQGDTLARQVVVSNLKTEQPEETLFTLPNGQMLLGENTQNDE
ncbi:hypothetical protein [Candidatus Agathobaculum pullicola]|uniref:hypothetical protein n=1 Tax=Candidatus Agathobaculum pullicola TaxID=2838426 RepID=UPI003F903E8E